MLGREVPVGSNPLQLIMRNARLHVKWLDRVKMLLELAAHWQGDLERWHDHSTGDC